MRLLSAAAVLHILLVILVFCTGSGGLLPAHFDRNGIGQFAYDSYRYQTEMTKLSDLLTKGEITAWLAAPPDIHVKIYSLSSAVLGPFIGFNILSVEPVNLFYYLLTVWLVFQLTVLTFGRRAAVIAAVVTALWPTLLMHSTQLLRDPLFIAAFLAVVFVIGLWCAKTLSWSYGFWSASLAVAGVLTIFIVRPAIWDIARLLVGLGTVLLIVRQIAEKKFLAGNVAAATMLLTAIVIIPKYETIFNVEPKKDIGGDVAIAVRVLDEPLWKRISERRRGFINPQDDESESIPASNIDMDVQFNSTADVVSYVPRAAVIGFFSPFPDMWLGDGFKVGSAGRKLSGVEMLITYLMEALAVIGVWYKRRLLITWLLVLTTILGVIALSLIVLNIGSLYRIRYPFWILIVVLGAGGLAYLAETFSQPREARTRLTSAPEAL